jgi:hypothetical protein
VSALAINLASPMARCTLRKVLTFDTLGEIISLLSAEQRCPQFDVVPSSLRHIYPSSNKVAF